MGVFSALSKSLKNIGTALTTTNWGKSLLGGLGAFFGFEWLTSGGLVESTSSALGVSESTGSLILIVVIALGIYLVFRYLDSRIPARSSGGRRR